MRLPLMIRLVAVTTLAFAVAACGSSGTGPAASGPSVTIGDATCGIAVSSTMTAKPAIAIPACATKPVKFNVTAVVPGTGAVIQAGQNVTVRYVGVAWSTKKQFDASWDRNPNTFTVTNVGSGPVIMGWNIGLTNQKVGSRLLLEIPPDMGYGPDGQGTIGPNETLIFIVDIVSAT